jgi:hypothetical protein
MVLDAAGNRPATGRLNTDEEVLAQLARGNSMLSNYMHELRFEFLEIVDVAGISQWFYAEPESSFRDALRDAARSNPSAYHWRSDAVNIYITGAWGTNAGGIAKFPPDNDIILLPQGAWDNVLAHEVGHILNLKHTHEDCFLCGGDSCDDTLDDKAEWNRDQISSNAFNLGYAQLTGAQKRQVDLVWFNVMSYHNGNTAFQLSTCQQGRMSNQAYDDRNRLLSKVPVYVNASYGGSQSGSFSQPYQTIQQAINAGALAGRVLVLEQGGHSAPSSTINTATEIITRGGISSVRCLPVPYILPCNLQESTNAQVRAWVVWAQQLDRAHDKESALQALVQAETHARKREKTAIQMELAERHRDAQRFEEAAAWFQKVVDDADQPGLKQHALEDVNAMKKQSARPKGR